MAKRATIVTERGQVSIPAELRKRMRLEPGQRLLWEQVSDWECRVIVARKPKPEGAKAVLGFARRLRPGRSRSTATWLRLLREGEV
jgi:AbrB family looped-hinge helix DNA binding protein